MKTGFLAFLAAAAQAVLHPVTAFAAANLGENRLGGVNVASGTGSGVSGVIDAIVKIINMALEFVAVIAVAVIIIAGFRLIISQGEGVDQARKAIIYAVVGIIIILISGTIVNVAMTLF